VEETPHEQEFLDGRNLAAFQTTTHLPSATNQHRSNPFRRAAMVFTDAGAFSVSPDADVAAGRKVKGARAGRVS
jgi:hypothetical protein